MSRDIRVGRWVQFRARLKMAWGRLIGNEALTAEGNAELIAGTLQETYGLAKKQTVRDVTRGIDSIASAAKRTARTLSR